VKCRHIHAHGFPCHVFVPDKKKGDDEESEEETESEEEDEEEEEEEEEEDDDEDDDDTDDGNMGLAKMMEMGKKAAKGALSGAKDAARRASKREAREEASAERRRSLPTPAWAADLFSLKRCNCTAGVPPGSKAFWPVGAERFVLGPLGGAEAVRINLLGDDPEGGWQKFQPVKPPEGDVLRLAFEWANPRTLAKACCVNKAWSVQAALHEPYVDMHRCREVCSHRAHDQGIVSLATFRGHAYTSGDCSVKAWNMKGMDPKATVTTVKVGKAAKAADDKSPSGGGGGLCCRDTTDMLRILECDAYLYCASSNGALRKWSMPFDPRKCEFRGQMWLHNKVINDACHFSGGASQSTLFTACDDRTVKVWDLVSNCQLTHTIQPFDPHSGTPRAVAVSSHWLFCGSSNGQIYVYPTAQVCKRLDRHPCMLPPGPVPYCLQAVLRHGSGGERNPGTVNAAAAAAAVAKKQKSSGPEKPSKAQGGAGADPETQTQEEDEDEDALSSFEPQLSGEEPVVTCLCVGGLHKREDRLFSGGQDGEVWVWNIPVEGVDFQCLHRLRSVHAGFAVNQIKCSWAHLITAGDDGSIRLFSLNTLDWGHGGTAALERVHRVDGRVRCIHVADQGDVEPGCSFLYAATNRGFFHVFRLGSHI